MNDINLKTENPAISIIVPVYNVEKYLERCLNSILKQSFTNWECILIDDGSKDKSSSICDFFADKDRRFKVIHQKNQGVSQARNTGIDLATGEWIAFVDSDDWIENSMLQDLYNAAIDNKADAILCGYYRTNGKRKVEEYRFNRGWFKIPDDLVIQLNSTWGKLFKTSIIKNNNIRFPLRITYCEDACFTFYYFLISAKIYAIEKSLYNYYRNMNSIVNTITSKKIEDGILVNKFIEEKLGSKLQNINWQTYLLEKKIHSKNMYALRLPKPDIENWRNCYPELTDLIIEKSKGIRRFYYICLKNNKRIIVNILYFLIKLRRFYIYNLRPFKVFKLEITGTNQ